MARRRGSGWGGSTASVLDLLDVILGCWRMVGTARSSGLMIGIRVPE